MIRPHPLAFMPGIRALMSWKGAVSITWIMACQVSRGKASTGSMCWKPALLTRMSTPSAAASFPKASTACGSARSAWRKTPPSSSASQRASFTSWTRTLAPSRAKARAMARPMPLPAPVTKTAFPESIPMAPIYRLRYASRTRGSWASAEAGP
jgi:hypothetical protein